jgi:hypothetical protein
MIAILVIWWVPSYIFYEKGKTALLGESITPPEEMIGKRCNAVEPLNPRGYVRISNELWRAVATVAEVKVGEEVVVDEISGLTLLVSPLDKDSEGNGDSQNTSGENPNRDTVQQSHEIASATPRNDRIRSVAMTTPYLR